MGKFRGGRFSKKAQPVPEKPGRALESWLPPELLQRAIMRMPLKNMPDVFEVIQAPTSETIEQFKRMMLALGESQGEYIYLGIDEEANMPTNNAAQQKRVDQLNELERLRRRGQISEEQYYEIKHKLMRELSDEVNEVGERFERRNPNLPEINESETPDPENDVKVEITVHDPVTGSLHRAGCFIPGQIWQEALEIDRDGCIEMLLRRLGKELTMTTKGRMNVQF